MATWKRDLLAQRCHSKPVRTALVTCILASLPGCSAHAGTPVSDVDIILQKVPGGSFFNASQESIVCHGRELAAEGLPSPVSGVPQEAARSRSSRGFSPPTPAGDCNSKGQGIEALRSAIDRLSESRGPGGCCDEAILAQQLRELQNDLETQVNLVTEAIRTISAAAELLENRQDPPGEPQLSPEEKIDCLSGLETYLQIQRPQE